MGPFKQAKVVYNETQSECAFSNAEVIVHWPVVELEQWIKTIRKVP